MAIYAIQRAPAYVFFAVANGAVNKTKTQRRSMKSAGARPQSCTAMSPQTSHREKRARISNTTKADPKSRPNQRASQPSHSPSFPPLGAGFLRLELLPNSYCLLLLPGRPPLTGFARAFASLHSSLQNHFVLAFGAFSMLTQAKWNHSRGHSE